MMAWEGGRRWRVCRARSPCTTAHPHMHHHMCGDHSTWHHTRLYGEICQVWWCHHHHTSAAQHHSHHQSLSTATITHRLTQQKFQMSHEILLLSQRTIWKTHEIYIIYTLPSLSSTHQQYHHIGTSVRSFHTHITCPQAGIIIITYQHRHISIKIPTKW